MRLNKVLSTPLDAWPVGSVYIGVGAESPATLLGGGTWEKVENAFLVAAGSDYELGTTGGSKTHTHTTGDVTLTADQIPSHTHSVGAHAHGLNSHTHTLNNHTHTTALGSHNHSVTTTAKDATKALKLANAYLSWGKAVPNPTDSGSFNSIHGWKSSDEQFIVEIPALSGTAASKDLGSKTSGGPSSNNTGAASGNTANSTAFDSGAAGGGKAHNHGATGGVFPAAVPGGVGLEARRVA